MPFAIGNKLNVGSHRGGRRGYEYEKKQLDSMKKLLNRFIVLADKIYDGKATPQQKDAFERLRPFVMKAMDKIHASKSETKVDVAPVKIQISRDYD